MFSLDIEYSRELDSKVKSYNSSNNSINSNNNNNNTNTNKINISSVVYKLKVRLRESFLSNNDNFSGDIS